MSRLSIVVSGLMLRYPLGGHTWHDLQYLVGFQRMGHKVVYAESYGWPFSCYDPQRDEMTANPGYGIGYLRETLKPYGLEDSWCYLDENERAHGMSRQQLSALCRECDLFVDIGNVNAIPEMEECRRRVLVDADPVFTQIGGHGLNTPLSHYDALFTYGENVHQPFANMPTGGHRWQSTRQPVVLDLWPIEVGDPAAPFSTVMNWSAYGDREYEGQVYGQKDREFEPFFSLPHAADQPMEVAIHAPPGVQDRLSHGGWRLADPRTVAATPLSYQRYLIESRAEFSVAKHGYVSTHCGWFSDRSAAYMASGRPVLIEETGFSEWLPSGVGVIPFSTYEEAIAGIQDVNSRYVEHCHAARALAEEFFDSRNVLTELLEHSSVPSSRVQWS